MPNDYYNPSANPVTDSRGLSSVVRSEYTAVGAGFDLLPSLNTLWGGHVDYYADTGTLNAIVVAGYAGITLTDGLTVSVKVAFANTGSVSLKYGSTAVTATCYTDGNDIASGAFVAGSIVTFKYSSTLGKWIAVTSGERGPQGVPGPGAINTVGATVTDNYTIASTTPTIWPVATTAIGKSITAPSATTLTEGLFAVIDNQAGTYPVGWRDSTGAVVGKYCVAAGGIAEVYLEDNSTAAGTWRIAGVGLQPGLITVDSTFSSTYGSVVYAPFAALSSDVSIHFCNLVSNGFAAFAVDNVTKVVGTPVAVTTGASKVPLIAFAVSSTTAIVFYNDDANDTEAVIISLSGATTLAVGTSQMLAANGSGAENSIGAPKIIQLTSTLYGLSGVTATGAGSTYVAACSVSGTTITWGATANIIAANNIASSTTSYALTATTFFVGYKSGAAAPYANNGVVISVSGTTCTVGTPATLTNVASSLTGAPISCKLSATTILMGDDNNTAGTVRVSAFTISGTTVTAGTHVVVETGATSQVYTTNSATRNNPHLFPLTATTAGLWYFTSDISRVVVLTESAGTVTAGSKMYGSISPSTNFLGAILPQGTTEFFGVHREGSSPADSYSMIPHKVSGTTITCGASCSFSTIPATSATNLYFTRLTSGDYVFDGITQGGITSFKVFRTNGDAINQRGEISCPAIAHDSADLVFPLGVSSNRIVVLGSSRTGSTIDGSTYQLRVLNLEIAQ